MRIYISGPITGTTDYMERFAAAECELWYKGWDDIVNPAEILSVQLPEGSSWETYMGESLKLLCECDAIYMMRGWEGSRGARLEHVVAEALELRVLEQEYDKK